MESGSNLAVSPKKMNPAIFWLFSNKNWFGGQSPTFQCFDWYQTIKPPAFEWQQQTLNWSCKKWNLKQKQEKKWCVISTCSLSCWENVWKELPKLNALQSYKSKMIEHVMIFHHHQTKLNCLYFMWKQGTQNWTVKTGGEIWTDQCWKYGCVVESCL